MEQQGLTPKALAPMIKQLNLAELPSQNTVNLFTCKIKTSSYSFEGFMMQQTA